MMAALHWSIFASHAASRVSRGNGEWAALIEMLRNAGPYPNKAACPWIKLAAFGDRRTQHGSLRNNANVEVVYGLEGDYDGGEVSLDDALAMLEKAGIRACVYTSPSHTPEKPRWRVLAPLHRPALPEQREGLVARLNGALGGILAPESFTLSQSYYYGYVEGAREYRVLATFDDPDDGTCVDELHELDAVAVGRPGAARFTDDGAVMVDAADPADVFARRVEQLGRRLRSGDGRREMLKSYVASRSARGIRGADLLTLVKGICATYFDPADPVDERNIAEIANWAQGRDIKAAQDAAQMVGALMPKAVPVAEVKIAPAPRAPASASLIAPPGMLGTITDWINATARKPQPAFAVQTAIAFAATVLGRRFVSDERNWPSLFLLNIGESASGKEYAKKAVEQLLEACGLEHLIGPSGYTSASGLLSALHDQPCHIAILDEFGKEVEMANIKNNERAKSTQKLLIEVWGRCDGTVRPQGYSTVGMSERDIARMKERVVRNPALTMLAMTTPDSFFGSVGSAASRDGFLNRFLIVESDIGPQVSQAAQNIPVPESIKEWARAMQEATAGIVDPTAAGSSSLIPTPIEVPFSKEAVELHRNYDAECIRRYSELKHTGLHQMVGRCREISMKLALIVACGGFAGAPEAISGPDMAWAINYVRHHFERAIYSLINCVSDSEFEAAKLQVLNLLRQAGARGLTEREIDKGSRKFRSVPQRQQVELLNSLQFVGHVQRVEIPPTSGRGKSRLAWVAVDDSADTTGTDGVPA